MSEVSEEVCTARMKSIEDRVDKVEVITNEIHNLSISVERLATTVENMLVRLTEQEKRLSKVEDKDADMWQTVVKYALTAAVGAMVGFFFKKVGIL